MASSKATAAIQLLSEAHLDFASSAELLSYRPQLVQVASLKAVAAQNTLGQGDVGSRCLAWRTFCLRG